MLLVEVRRRQEYGRREERWGTQDAYVPAHIESLRGLRSRRGEACAGIELLCSFINLSKVRVVSKVLMIFDFKIILYKY